MSSLSDRILEAQRVAMNNGEVAPQRQMAWGQSDSNPNLDQSQPSHQNQQQQSQQQQAMYGYDMYNQQQYSQMLMQQQMMGMQMGGPMMGVDPSVTGQGMAGWQGQPPMMGMPMQGQNPSSSGPVTSLHQPGHPSHQLQNQQQQMPQMSQHQQPMSQQQQQMSQQQMMQPGSSHQFNGAPQGQQSSGPPGSKGKGGGPPQPPPQETAPGAAPNMMPIPSPPHMLPNASMMQQPGGKGMGSQMSIGSSGGGGGGPGTQGPVNGNMSLLGTNQAPMSGAQGPMGQQPGPSQPQMMMPSQGMMMANAHGQYGMQHMMMVPNNYMMQQQFPLTPPFEEDGAANVREDKRGMQPKQRPGGAVGRRDLTLFDENHPGRRPRDPTRESWADVTDSPKGASENILLDMSDDRMNRKGGKDMGKGGKTRGKDNMGFGNFSQQGGPVPGGMGGFGPGGAPPPPIVPGGMMGEFGMDDRKLRQNLFEKQPDAQEQDFGDAGKGKGKKSSKSIGQDSSGVSGKGKGGKGKAVDDFNFSVPKGKGSTPGKGAKQIPMQMLPRGPLPSPPPHGRVDDFKGETQGFKGGAMKGTRKDKGFKGKEVNKGDKGEEFMGKGLGGKKNKGGFGKQPFTQGGKFDSSPRKMMDRELTDWFALRMGGNGPEGSSGSHPQGGKGSQQWKAKASPDDSQQWKQKQGQDGDKNESKKNDKDQTAKGRSKQNVKNEARNARQKDREQGSNADKDSEKRTSGSAALHDDGFARNAEKTL